MKYFLILNLTLFISVYAFSQQAELTLTLSKPDGANASGIVSVSGTDTSMQKALENGTVHFVLRQITGLNEPAREELFQLYPNPAKRSVHIYFQEDNHTNVSFEVYNLTGQKIGTLIPSVQPALQIRNSPGMLLVRAKKPGEKIDTRRLLTTSKSITFYLHSEPTNAAEAKSQIKSLNDSDSYTITFDDTTGHLARSTWERTIPLGTHEQIDTVIPWLYSFNIIGGLENTMCTWQDASGNNLHSGIDSTTLQVDTLEQPITIKALLELENYDNDTVVFSQVSSGAHEQTAHQVLTTYDHNWNGHVTSSKPGKTVKDGTRIGLVLDEDPEDTTWTQTTNQEYNIEQTLYEDEIGYKLVAKDSPGHEDKTINGTSTGTNNDDITLQGLTYDATIPLHVQSDGEAIQGATITHEEGTTTTGTNGEATINDTNLETNTYNEPLNTYNQTITTDAEGYEEEQTSIQYNHADNDTQTITLQPTTYEYWIHGNTNAPNTNIKGWKDGEDIFTSTSNNGSYETNHQTSTLEQLVLDSLVANAEGYQKAKILEFTMQPGGTRQDINLEEEPQNNTYNLKLLIGNDHGEPETTPGTITLDLGEGETYDININNGIAEKTITTTKPPSTTANIDINIPGYTNSFTIAQSPATTKTIATECNLTGYENQQATPTLEQITNQTENTYLLGLREQAINDTTMTILAGGNKNGTVKYDQPEVTIYNWQEKLPGYEPITEQRDSLHKEVMKFIYNHTTTPIGLTLVQADTTSTETMPSGEYSLVIYQDDNTNASHSIGWTSTHTFDDATAHTRENDGDNSLYNESYEGFYGAHESNYSNHGAGFIFYQDDNGEWKIQSESKHYTTTRVMSMSSLPGSFKKQ